MNLHTLENLIFRKVAPHTIRHLARPNLKSGDAKTKKIVSQLGREFQVAPPFTLHLSSPGLLAGLWSATRESLIVNARNRAMREATAAAVSGLNECPYCVDVHNPMMVVARGNAGASKADAGSDQAAISAAAQWASATLDPQAENLRRHRVAPEHIPQVFGTAVCFHYVNRMVNIFLDKSPVPMPGGSTRFGRYMTRASLGIFGKRIVSLDGKPGDFLIEAGANSLPREFAWAESNANVAGGLQRFANAAYSAGEESVHEDVRALLLNHLENWRGEAPPLSRSWVEQAMKGLDDELKPAARLALLAARASWQVDDGIIADFRALHPDDKTLVDTTGWASFMAVRRIASWLNKSAAETMPETNPGQRRIA